MAGLPRRTVQPHPLLLSRPSSAPTAGAAVGLDVGLRYFVGFQPVAAIIAALPISVGGLGVREGVLVELFGGIGVEESLAFATSILGYAAGILASLLGGIAFVVRRIQPVDDSRT